MKKSKKYSLKKNNLINTYGNNYSKIDLFLTVIIFVIVISVVCYLHKLQMIYMCAIIGTALVMVPFIISAYFKYKHEKLKFEEYCLYFENMKMYFKIYKKLITALQETYKVMQPESDMAKCIKKAINEIESTGDYEKALSYIDEKYHNTYLERLHSLLITGEKQGGDSVYYNLDNINYADWKEDISMFQKKKKSARYMFYFLAFLSVGLSIFSIIIYNDESMMNAIINDSTYQLYTFVELEVMLVMFIYVYISLVNKKWIRSDE